MNKIKDLLYDYSKAIESSCLNECDTRHEAANNKAVRIEKQILELFKNQSKVKQLAWEEKLGNYIGSLCHFDFATIMYVLEPVGFENICTTLNTSLSEVIDQVGFFKTLAEAKAACQKHYESLILSGLEVEDD